ncbi:hypothetical protein MMC17_003472 [Xylographa soralifera]|nr:hypothetical protein [Xylographa soralifera]
MYHFRTAAFFLLYTLSIVSSILTPRTSEDSSLPFISQIFCPEELPRGKYGNPQTNRSIRHTFELLGHLWHGWSSLNFTSLTQLCAANGNEQVNMGGRCVISPESTMNNIFYEASFDTGMARSKGLWDVRIEAYCEVHCLCADNDDEWLALALREAIYNKRIPPPSTWDNLEGEAYDGWDSTDPEWGQSDGGWLYHSADRRCAEIQGADRSRIPQRPRWCPPRPAGKGRVIPAGRPVQPATLPMQGGLPL